MLLSGPTFLSKLLYTSEFRPLFQTSSMGSEKAQFLNIRTTLQFLFELPNIKEHCPLYKIR